MAAAAVIVPSCMTNTLNHDANKAVPARLLNAPDSDMRSDLREAIRATYGPDYIADIETLHINGQAILQDRQSVALTTARIPVPPKTLQIMRTPGNQCWIADITTSDEDSTGPALDIVIDDEECAEI